MKRWMSALLCLGCISLTLQAQPKNPREEKVHSDKKKVEAEGYWIYNDLPKAFDEAKKTGKPMIVVLRCLPCVECVKLDDELIDADARVKTLLEKFVRVRVISTNGLDLSLFQYDTDQSFAVFLLNGDGTIYGRFGTRSDRKNWVGDVSVDGMAKAMQGTLDLHKDYAKVKDSLAAKRGPAPEFASPEMYPSLKEKYKSTINYQANVMQSCIHCHQIGDAAREVVFTRKQKLPDTLLFPYPHPKSLGLIFDPKEMATVLKVDPKSDAATAGFQIGDQILKLAGQPLVSIADVQWVLHNTPSDGADLKAEIMRAGKPQTLKLKLTKGWKDRDDISWRASTWGLRRKATGGILAVEMTPEERTKSKLPTDKTSLMVAHVGQFSPHNVAHAAGVRKGDILVSFDGRTDFLRETDLLAYSLREKKPGDTVELVLMRDGARKTISMKLP